MAETSEPPFKKAKIQDDDPDEDGPEAWDAIFGGESAEREQPYNQYKILNVPLAKSEDGELETYELASGFPTADVNRPDNHSFTRIPSRLLPRNSSSTSSALRPPWSTMLTFSPALQE